MQNNKYLTRRNFSKAVGLRIGGVILLGFSKKNNSPRNQTYQFVERENPMPLDKSMLPNSVFDAHHNFVELYWKAWEHAWEHVVKQGNIIQSPYMDEAFCPDTIWIWDIYFMTFFCKHAPDLYPGIESLGNFYEIMHNNHSSPLYIQHPDNPPLFARAAWECFKVAPNLNRLNKIVNEKKNLQKHYNFFENRKEGAEYPWYRQGCCPKIKKKGKTIISIICTVFCFVSCNQNNEQALPNIIIFYTDDQGYEDLSCFGAKGYSTPNIDELAKQGMKFTNFYVANAVCMPSRAALLTGTYPARNLTTVGMADDLPSSIHKVNSLDYSSFSTEEQHFFNQIKTDSIAKVILQRDGLHLNEITIAEVLKQKDYKTAMFGKWHLGYFPEFWPRKQGFDYFYGIPYSHDMYPSNNNPWAIKNHIHFPPLPLIENDSIIEYNPDFTSLTKQYTERAKSFIKNNQDKPFFLYMAYNFPHVPLAASKKFMKNNTESLYGKVLEEIDWSVGEISDAIQKYGMEGNTLIIFASDNGPWLCYGNHAGSAGELREGKKTVFEGGVRVPAIMKWPGVIPPGETCSAPAMIIDILPTIAKLVRAKLPNHKIDGKSILPLMKGEKQTNNRAYLFYGGGNDLAERKLLAIRQGKWKLVFPHKFPSLNDKKPGINGEAVSYCSASTDTALYNLTHDIGEKNNIKESHPEIVKKLVKTATKMDSEIKNNRRPGAFYSKKIER